MKQINIFGDIIASEADRWFASEVTPAQIVDALKDAGGEPVEVLINSNGGSVAAGLAISNAIKQYPGETTCVVLGLAASMASVIACAGKTLKMGEGAFLMIHNPWTYTSGNAEELRKDADTLDKMRDSILGFYLGKCPDKEDELKAAMDAESWLTREDARAMGFAVEDYEGELKAAASLTRRAIGKAPDAVKALFEIRAEKPVAEATEKPVEAPEKAEATDAKPEAETPAEAQETASETVAEVSRPEEVAAKQSISSPCDWEMRYKGLSKKYNEAKSEHDKTLAARDEEIKNLKCQMEKQTQALADATAKVSELAAQVEEKDKALQTAQKDLADARDSLTKAEDKAKQLEDTRDMLTAGVLTPPAESGYAAKMKAAKTPEEREALRAQKRAGKIK